MTDAAVVRTAGRLPAEVTSFVGRRRELAETRRLLEGARLVTLLGPGGVGKTRLALRVAREARRSFPGGVCFVDLAAVRGPGVLAQAVADALDLRDQSTRPPVEVLTGHVADRRLLLVFDTCEHMLDECAILVEVLLRAGPGVRVLATSRQALDVPGEHTLPVAPLGGEGGTGEAVTLFAERAAAALPGFAVTPDNRPDVERLCRRLDGIPLAIELAAVRLRALPLDHIVARLGDRFLLTGERRTGQSRHQTLRDAIDWSHGLCAPAERTAWARLSVFPDGCDLAAAEAVCAGDDLPAGRVTDVVAGLVDKSVLTRADRRYRMLDTLREYGAGLLAERGETGTARARFRDHYLAATGRLAAGLSTAAQPEWFAWTVRESPTLRVLLDRMIDEGDADGALRLVARLTPVWFALGRLREARLWGDRALATAGGGPDARFQVLVLNALVALHQDDRDAERALLDRAAAVASGPADVAYLTQLRGTDELLGGDVVAAARLLDEAVAEHHEHGNRDVMALSTRLYLAGARLVNGDLAGALATVQELVDLCRAAGERWCLSHALWTRGGVRMFLGETAEAEADLAEGLRLAVPLDARVAVISNLEALAMVAVRTAEFERAARLFAAAHVLREAQGLSVMAGAFEVLLEADLARVRQELGERAFADAWAAGLAMTDAESVACALRETAPRASEPTPAGRLTRREREIAELVAEGLSNREIAARLVISKRTVDSHLEHILGKLGFTSRTQVAAWVIREG
ncbi:LuxR C-terminal-related transcriptional regulator [Actinomadura kijaniata]|uniref:LuxR C-terminal-related transcriptional regulator n=1 Tax=Actinomadura kijaniata TaxID=46161 RepID=UPI00083564DE|nr:LuxR C-terminal-related transcriptional regulator [Actinomadura kijaniata]